MSIINLHHGDSLEAMRSMPDNHWDLAICDPPYGNKNYDAMHKTSSEAVKKAKRGTYKAFKNEKPTDEYFEELLRVSKNQIIWGANFFGLMGGYICWNKNGSCFGEAELAYCSLQLQVSVFEYTWNGMLQQDMKNKESRIHPTQKPIALYKWLLENYAKPGDKILDTHGGSMSIAIACYDLCFDLDLWEIDEDYYKAGKERFDKHVLYYEKGIKQIGNVIQQSLFSA